MNRDYTKDIVKRRRYPRGARGVPKKSSLLRKSKHMQRWFLRNPWIKPMLCFNLAVMKIQVRFATYSILFYSLLCRFMMKALARGYIVRQLGAKQWRKKLYKKKRAQPSQLNRYLANLDFYSRLGRWKPTYLEEGYSSWCAVRLQAWWRMVPKRRHFLYHVKYVRDIICSLPSRLLFT